MSDFSFEELVIEDVTQPEELEPTLFELYVMYKPYLRVISAFLSFCCFAFVFYTLYTQRCIDGTPESLTAPLDRSNIKRQYKAYAKIIRNKHD